MKSNSRQFQQLFLAGNKVSWKPPPPPPPPKKKQQTNKQTKKQNKTKKTDDKYSLIAWFTCFNLIMETTEQCVKSAQMSLFS